MDSLSLYNILIDVLPSGSLEILVRTAAEHLKQHIVVLDTSYKVLASYPREHIGDPYWDAQQEFGMVPEENLQRIFEYKYPEATFKGTSYIDWGDIKFPRAVASVQYKDKSLGHVSVYHTDNALSREEIIEACQCLDRLLRVFFVNTNGVKLTNNAVSSALLSRIFMGQKITPLMLAQWGTAVGTSLCGSYFLLAIKSTDVQHDKSSIILNYIRNFHQAVDSAEMNGYHYFLFYNISSPRFLSGLFSHISNLLDRYKISGGISSLFDSLTDIQSYMFQSRKALKLGSELQPEQTLYHYTYLLSDIMLSYISDSLDTINSMHPVLRNLKEEDTKCGTQYYETLVTYLNCMCESALSAKALNIHRNTLLYRINHIQDKFKISFTDTELTKSLALSAYVCSFNDRNGVCEKTQEESLEF